MSGERSRKFYTTKGKLKRIKKHERWGVLEVLLNKYLLSKEEAEPLADFMGKVLKWDMNDRSSAEELLKHEWLHMPPNWEFHAPTEPSDKEKSDNEEDEDEEETGETKEETPSSDDGWETVESESEEEEENDD